MSAPALGGYDVDPICAGTSYLSWLRMLMFSGKNINSWSEVLPILCGPTWTTALGLASLFAESARIARGSAPAPAARTVESMARSPSPSSRVGGRQLPGARGAVAPRVARGRVLVAVLGKVPARSGSLILIVSRLPGVRPALPRNDNPAIILRPALQLAARV